MAGCAHAPRLAEQICIPASSPNLVSVHYFSTSARVTDIFGRSRFKFLPREPGVYARKSASWYDKKSRQRLHDMKVDSCILPVMANSFKAKVLTPGAALNYEFISLVTSIATLMIYGEGIKCSITSAPSSATQHRVMISRTIHWLQRTLSEYAFTRVKCFVSLFQHGHTHLESWPSQGLRHTRARYHTSLASTSHGYTAWQTLFSKTTYGKAMPSV